MPQIKDRSDASRGLTIAAHDHVLGTRRGANSARSVSSRRLNQTPRRREIALSEFLRSHSLEKIRPRKIFFSAAGTHEITHAGSVPRGRLREESMCRRATRHDLTRGYAGICTPDRPAQTLSQRLTSQGADIDPMQAVDTEVAL
jgi:hypothetical protein